MLRSITPLLRSDAARIEDRLTRLCAEDRSPRFAAGPVADATIRRHVAASGSSVTSCRAWSSRRSGLLASARRRLFTVEPACAERAQGR